MSQNSQSEEARREAARKRLQERQARLGSEGASRSARPAGQGGRAVQQQIAQQQAGTQRQAQGAPRQAAAAAQTPAQRVHRGATSQQRAAQVPQQGAQQRRMPQQQAQASQAAPVGQQRRAPQQQRAQQQQRRVPQQQRAQQQRRTPQQAAPAKAGNAVVAAAQNAFGALESRLGKTNALIALVAAVVLLIVLIFGIASCVGPADPVKEAAHTAEQAATASSYANEDGTTIDEDALAQLIGSEDAQNLLTQASESEDAYWIATHPDAFTDDGTAVQVKLLKLAGKESKAIEYVRNWPDEHGQETANGDASQASAEGLSAVPLLFQWDTRWGYTVYSSTSFAVTGCCPTSLAMVYQGLTGNTDKSPYDMGVLANQMGYETQYDGTDGRFLVEVASQLGLSCSELSAISTNITAPLSAGQLLIVNMGPGTFTTSGHYIVVCGLTDDGKVIVNDPYSYTRSIQTWDVDTLVSEAISIYAYSVA